MSLFHSAVVSIAVREQYLSHFWLPKETKNHLTENNCTACEEQAHRIELRGEHAFPATNLSGQVAASAGASAAASAGLSPQKFGKCWPNLESSFSAVSKPSLQVNTSY